MRILDNVDSPSDVKALPADKLELLCADLREFLINSVSKTGGHLAANLGVVELTVACRSELHKMWDELTDTERLGPHPPG